MARFRDAQSTHSSGDLARMLKWAEARLLSLKGELTPEGIAASPQERELFPEADPLLPAEPEEC
jgi:hypothetical protein